MTRSDAIVLTLAAVLVAALYAAFWGRAGAAEAVEIRVLGRPPVTLPLTGDRRYTVRGALGDSVLEIRAGRVRFVDSPCRGRQCIHSGWLEAPGAAAACLPNRVSIRILGRDPRYDAVNF